MISYSPKRSRGFTLIELILVMSIIGILATVAFQNYGTSKVRAYNTNLKSSVQQYSQAMELYNAQNRTYLVTSSPACEVGSNQNGNAIPNAYTLQGTGAGCVGLDGSGEGRMTRRGTAGLSSFEIASKTGISYGSHSYAATSIADALVAQGMLKEVRSYPNVSSFTSNSPDYVLTLCDDDGVEAASSATATHFAVYAALKTAPAPTTPEAAKTNHLCGSKNSGHGWNTAVDWVYSSNWVPAN
jgi:prepilin-type N-terminal cleavage/methylation domain-containing protein